MRINSDWFYGEFLEFWTFFFESYQSHFLISTTFQWKGRQKCILICHRINWMWWFQRAKSSNWVILTPQMKKNIGLQLEKRFFEKKPHVFHLKIALPWNVVSRALRSPKRVILTRVEEKKIDLFSESNNNRLHDQKKMATQGNVRGFI